MTHYNFEQICDDKHTPQILTHIVKLPFSAGGLNLLPNFEKGLLDRILILEEVVGKEGTKRGCSFYVKITVKYEIFHDKVYKTK